MLENITKAVALVRDVVVIIAAALYIGLSIFTLQNMSEANQRVKDAQQEMACALDRTSKECRWGVED